MRVSANWLVLVCLSFAACSDDKNGQSEDAVTSSDASTAESDKDSTDSKKSSAGAKAGSSKQASAGAGGSKAASGSASGEKGSSPDANGDDAKKNEDAKKDSKDEKKDDNKPSDGEKGKDSDKPADKPAGGETPAGSDSDKPKQDQGTSTVSTPATNGDQLAVCSRSEGDCNQGLACHAPAGPFSAGRGYCSKICREDADCSGLAPEGTKYTCSNGPGTSTCEVACSGADDKSCPSGLVCVQTGARRRPAAASDAGMPESTADAGAARASAYEPVFGCRHAFETSKLWGPCGDASHACGEGLRCAASFWFGAGHCTKDCASDADCDKPESGSAKPTCATLVPAFGDTPAVKQCALSCAEAKDGCPTGLACFEGPQTRASEGAEPMPAFAFCQ